MKYVDNFYIRVRSEQENDLIEALRDRGLRCYMRCERQDFVIPTVEFWYEAAQDGITPEDIAEWTKHMKRIIHFVGMRETSE